MVQRITVFLFTCLTSFSVASLGSARVDAAGAAKVTSPPAAPQAAARAILAQSGSATSPNALPPVTSPSTSPILLAPGTQSSDVIVLQQQLQQLGHYDGPIDGSYGPATRKAVQSFQQQAALPTTGSLDQQTWVQMQTPQLWPKAPSDVNSPVPTPAAGPASGNVPASNSAQPDSAVDPGTVDPVQAPGRSTSSPPAADNQAAPATGDSPMAAPAPPLFLSEPSVQPLLKARPPPQLPVSPICGS